MTRILAIDTATDGCSVAVLADVIRATRGGPCARGHAEALMPMVAGAMAEAGLSFRDLDAVVAVVGPGGFTGLRAGLAAARGLALAAAVPCFGVTSLEAAVAEARGAEEGDRTPWLSAIDSKQGDLFVQLFAGDGRALTEPDAVPPGDCPLLAGGRSVRVVGSGRAAAIEALRRAGIDTPAVAASGRVRAAAVAEIAARRLRAQDDPLLPPSPLYLRGPATGRCATGLRRAG